MRMGTLVLENSQRYLGKRKQSQRKLKSVKNGVEKQISFSLLSATASDLETFGGSLTWLTKTAEVIFN